MITRIVKMKFKAESVDEFSLFIADRVDIIRGYDGCLGLKILKDKYDPTSIFTYSLWKDEKALDMYRHSDFFMETWRVTKSYFDAKPEAWSLDVLHDQ